MRIIIATIFPDFVKVVKEYGVISQAVKDGKLEIEILNLRDFTQDKHKTVDDYPYGGGPGMVMKPEPFYRLYDYVVEKYGKPFVVMTSPQGERFDNKIAMFLSKKENLLILCGRYEGVDERVMKIVDLELSIGDYVLSGGELAAMVICDAVSRFVPGVVEEESLRQDSFFNNLLDHPHYTRPAIFREMKVPEVLLSGNHEEIELYRLSESLKRTAIKRPDLFLKHEFTEKDKQALILLIRGLDKKC
ncbi:tRNA (guanosine(37)-N1)-methyltransferase TrmD [Pseudothermotoga thermarum]|uniref:tRNA (guanine-N(1)-)-methyltransferase n=1 Tax=Pseudothermotoga thermarum DSM 5069 TaxID=688269 RepID=F7YY57_9THEM|nr:tRNA (guanosine(37)-N1)-methyltransferase TrmD [Pseudothermotoga thermarum]AEH50871.1 tRNA (Guanine37-N(1)-) methyltransferase [Pseudothermotoga thermarum DSM 5069]